MGKKTMDKKSAIAFKELQEEESQPLFSEGQLKTFESGYIEGMDEALSLFDEERTLTDHLKGRDKE